MQVGCSHCGCALEFSHQPPRFCSNCGRPFSSGAEAPTVLAAPPAGPGATIPFLGARTEGTTGPPQAIGGYRLLHLLGGGGMGTVYEAEESATGRRVAVKLIRPEFADSPDAVERFRREGRLAGTIAHPRCVFVLAAEEDAGQPYIVMELMPGDTLHDLVEKHGPLPVSEAVAHVLDVVEGLQEAHRCGVVHRDVKPNNCFLDSGGRVKVGDFGLSKSLVQAEHLTRSGAFLGTVLFAAPEQVRNDRVDHLADVYSACATLYYLLTGKAPFEADDAATALARALSDPLTPARAHRPEVPRTLDEVVRHGLARSRGRRWQSLEDLRLALLPFVPGTHSLGEVGWRCGAYLCDVLFLVPLHVAAHAALSATPTGLAGDAVGRRLASLGVSLACVLLYFTLPEALWGCTPGKYVTRLRVRSVADEDRPGLFQALWRALVFCGLLNGGELALGLLMAAGAVRVGGQADLTMLVAFSLVAVICLPVFGGLAGLGLMASTMRRRNGYRGLHELASGTKVIRLPAPRPMRGLCGGTATAGALSRPEGMPPRVGAFFIQGALRWGEDRLLLGEDPILGRPVWIWFRPAERGPLPPGRAEISRRTRPRWLGGGADGAWRWDAFVASPGCLLADAVGERKRRSWADALPLLEQLTAELVAASREGTLPATLGPEQVWVQPTGRALLLDAPLREGPGQNGPGGEEGALGLLRQAAALALEGRPWDEGSPARPLRAPVPVRAAELLRRLMGGPGAYTRLAELSEAIQEARERPAEVTRARRGMHLTLNCLTLGAGLAWMLGLGPALVVLSASILTLAGVLQAEGIERELRRHAACDSVALVTAPGAFHRLVFVSELTAGQQTREQLHQRLEQAPRDREVLLRSSSWFLRHNIDRMEEQMRGSYAKNQADNDPWAEAGAPPATRDRAHFAAELLGLPATAAVALLAAPLTLIGLFAFYPLAWATWGGLTRGGLGLRVAGIRLVRADGLPAARWRCAWRALVAWAPLVALLLASLSLDLWRVADTGPELPAEVGSLAWLAWLTWWLGAGLLPLYVWIALRWPERGPHDVLAGTYPVPR